MRCCGCASTSRRSAPSSSAPKATVRPWSRSISTLLAHQSHWLVREIIHFMKRTLKRVDLTSRTFFAFIEAGSAFAGSLFELALAADRSYMFHDDNEENVVASVADELRSVDDEQRADAPADTLPRRS